MSDLTFNLKAIYSLCLCLMIVMGCSNYVINEDPQLAVDIKPIYPSAPNNQTVDNATSDYWWSDFERPQLDQMILRSFEHNQLLAQAIASVNQARALSIQTRSQRLPQISLEANARDEWEGSDSQAGEETIGAALDWEIDLFKRIASAQRANQLETLARFETYQSVKLSLSAEIANAYFGAVAAQLTLKLLNSQTQLDQELLELLDLRLDNGIGTIVDVLQQQSRVAESDSLIPSAQAELRLFENRLDVLVGDMPDGINQVSDIQQLHFQKLLPFVGVPMDLLLNRPDLAAQKAELIAADANTAAAIADRLPRITLTGSYEYSNTSDFSGPLAIIMGNFIQPLLDWGQRKAEVDRNRAVFQQRLASFTQLFLEAVEDVENALYQEKQQREFIRRLEIRKELLQTTVKETEARYKQGVDDYLPVINALQELRVVERDLINESLILIGFRIQLHRAIGGSISLTHNERNADNEAY